MSITRKVQVCAGTSLAVVFAVVICFLLLLSQTPLQARRHVSKLLEISKENDVCELLKEIWPVNHDHHESWRWQTRRSIKNDSIELPTCENHDIWTKDGYLLRLKRLVASSSKKKGVVMLIPGLGDSSATWLMSGVDHSLAGLLWKSGFEVWLLDVRGRAPYKHKLLTPDQDEFWEWTLDEKIEHDIPEAIEFALKVSGSAKLKGIVAHSQGSLLTLLTLAENPRLSLRIENAFLFAPPLGGWSPRYAFFPKGLFYPFLHNLIPLNHLGEVFDSTRAVISRACLVLPWLCNKITCMASGCGAQSELSKERLSEIFTFYPIATSLKNIEHLLHCERESGVVLAYDAVTNSRKMEWKTISVPLYFYFGTADALVDERRYANGTELFTKGVVKQYKLLAYGHADFVWGENAKEHIYDEILQVISHGSIKH